MISTGIVRSIDSLGRVVLPKELRTTYDITPDTRLRFLPMGIPSLCASTTRRAAAFSAATFLPTPCCSTANTSARLPQGTGQVRPTLLLYPRLYKRPVQANCTGSYFGFTPPFQPAHGFSAF